MSKLFHWRFPLSPSYFIPNFFVVFPSRQSDLLSLPQIWKHAFARFLSPVKTLLEICQIHFYSRALFLQVSFFLHLPLLPLFHPYDYASGLFTVLPPPFVSF